MKGRGLRAAVCGGGRRLPVREREHHERERIKRERELQEMAERALGEESRESFEGTYKST